MLYHRNMYPSLTHLGRPLIVFAQTAAATQPGEGPLDDPTLRYQDEAFGTRRPFDDLQEPQPVAENPGHQPVTHIDAVGVNRLHPGERSAALIEDQLAPVVVLHVGRRNHNGQHQTQSIYHQMPLPTGDFLAAIIAPRTA